jgi:catechol 2,3-dioxygenase-like lactoylglutathione lyase family enzyme
MEKQANAGRQPRSASRDEQTVKLDGLIPAQQVDLLRPQRAEVAAWLRGLPELAGHAHAEESRTGLDHISFQVADRAALEAWIDRLDKLNIGHTGIRRRPNGPYATVVFRDPDNNQL